MEIVRIIEMRYKLFTLKRFLTGCVSVGSIEIYTYI